MVTVRFARFSFERKLAHYNDKRDALERRKQALLNVISFETDVNALLENSQSSYLASKGEWGFGGVEVGDDYIAGRIGKEHEDTGRTKDPDERDYVQVEREDTDVAFFVIDLNSMVMAYEYRRNVGKKAPYRIVRDAFNAYHGGEETLSASALIDKEEISEELEQFAIITNVRFTHLHPTNPDHTDRSKPMDEFLRNSGIDDLLFDAEGDDDDGIDVRGTPMLDGGLSLAEEGYGQATLSGKDEDGEEKVVSTEDNPIESEVKIGDSDDRNRDKLLVEIRAALQRLDD